MIRYGFYNATGGHEVTADHMQHCFEYLRRAIMCAADTALEPYKVAHLGVDGFGSPHQCRDWSILYDWAEQFRSED